MQLMRSFKWHFVQLHVWSATNLSITIFDVSFCCIIHIQIVHCNLFLRSDFTVIKCKVRRANGGESSCQFYSPGRLRSENSARGSALMYSCVGGPTGFQTPFSHTLKPTRGMNLWKCTLLFCALSLSLHFISCSRLLNTHHSCPTPDLVTEHARAKHRYNVLSPAWVSVCLSSLNMTAFQHCVTLNWPSTIPQIIKEKWFNSWRLRNFWRWSHIRHIYCLHLPHTPTHSTHTPPAKYQTAQLRRKWKDTLWNICQQEKSWSVCHPPKMTGIISISTPLPLQCHISHYISFTVSEKLAQA